MPLLPRRSSRSNSAGKEQRALARLAVLGAGQGLLEDRRIDARRGRARRDAQAVARQHHLGAGEPLDLGQRHAVQRQAGLAGGLGLRALQPEVGDRVVHLALHHRLELALERDALVAAERDLRSQADLDLLAEVRALEHGHLVEVDALEADDLEAVLLDRLVERLLHEMLHGVGPDLRSELLLDDLRRHVAGAEALQVHRPARLADRALHGAVELGSGDGEAHARLAGAGLFDGDLHGSGWPAPGAPAGDLQGREETEGRGRARSGTALGP